jgi:leucyl aminopeptidase
MQRQSSGNTRTDGGSEIRVVGVGMVEGGVSCASGWQKGSAPHWALPHFDVYAWNPKPRAHAPAGGEIQAARALFELLSERYPRR